MREERNERQRRGRVAGAPKENSEKTPKAPGGGEYLGLLPAHLLSHGRSEGEERRELFV